MNTEKIYYQPVKEDRGAYFVEYLPPSHSYRLATLQLVFSEQVDISLVVDAMEKELRIWIKRYPIPLMVSSFDETGALYSIEKLRPCNSLIGYYDKVKKDIVLSWSLLKDDEIPDDALNLDYLKKVYSDIPHKTSQDVQVELRKHNKMLRVGWTIVFIWAVIIPAIIAIVECFSPQWVAVLILIYSLYKALRKALELLGKVKKSPKTLEQEREESMMQHHHYHCKLNPEGFSRLRAENFERQMREEIKKEANALKQN